LTSLRRPVPATAGPIAGPALGGWITNSYSWSWVFYVNIPVGLSARAATWVIYHRRETPACKLPIDIVGPGLLITWVAAIFQVDDASAYVFFNAVVDTQSAMSGLHDIFYISSVIFFVTIPLIWITKPARSAGSANAGNAH
jgi:DHA2 family multidrug resistance protein